MVTSFSCQSEAPQWNPRPQPAAKSVEKLRYVWVKVNIGLHFTFLKQTLRLYTFYWMMKMSSWKENYSTATWKILVHYTSPAKENGSLFTCRRFKNSTDLTVCMIAFVCVTSLTGCIIVFFLCTAKREKYWSLVKKISQTTFTVFCQIFMLSPV